MQQNKERKKKDPDKSQTDPAGVVGEGDGEGRLLLKDRLFQRSTSLEAAQKPRAEVSE